MTSPFKPGFLWGAATASYQIEGAAEQDGKGPSIWDDFCDTPGKVWRGNSGQTACDHYNRMPSDVALMRDMGLQAYRFSLSWPRILPEGTGRVNAAGLAFYDRLADELLAANIAPFCTLYHWDLPRTLHERGGWQNRDIADWFAEYTQVVAKRLGDRVKHWITLNEPQIFLGMGYQGGQHAPGLKLEPKAMLQAGHNALLAHGKAVQVLRANCPGAQIGFAPQTPVSFPSDESNPAHVQAAHQMTFSVAGMGHITAALLNVPPQNPLNNSWWMDAAFLGAYPEEGLAFYGDSSPDVQAGDMAQIGQPLDFCGVNIYFGFEIATDDKGAPKVVVAPPGVPRTGFDWPVTAKALRWGPRYFYERYKKPIVITENGLAQRDWVSLDGQVHDPQRIDFTTLYLRELAKAAQDGVDVGGYMHWSFMDNFEWAEGYKHRFGLVHVDYQTQVRTPKDSARWYKTVIDSHGANLG
jgi:beta-glucosidase